MQHRHEWGRTLIFAPSIDAAAALDAALSDLHVDVRRVDRRSGEVLNEEFRAWFERTDEAVVVSVAMLLVGVDLPLAQTALIARPTSSSTVLNQMVGRVLRRVEGQKEHAIVAYVQDEWAVDGRFEAILNAKTPWTSSDDPPDEDVEFEIGVADALARAISDLEDAQSRLLVERRALMGVYTTADDELIPVLDNQEAQLADFIRRLATDPEAGYDHGEEASPAPAPELLESLRAHMRKHPGDPPKLEPISRPLAPVDVARRLIAEPRADAERQRTIINDAYAASPIAGELYRHVAAFEQAVRRAELELQHGTAIIERSVVGEAEPDLLPHDDSRDLKPLWQEVWTFGELTDHVGYEPDAPRARSADPGCISGRAPCRARSPLRDKTLARAALGRSAGSRWTQRGVLVSRAVANARSSSNDVCADDGGAASAGGVWRPWTRSERRRSRWSSVMRPQSRHRRPRRCRQLREPPTPDGPTKP